MLTTQLMHMSINRLWQENQYCQLLPEGADNIYLVHYPYLHWLIDLDKTVTHTELDGTLQDYKVCVNPV